MSKRGIELEEPQVGEASSSGDNKVAKIGGLTGAPREEAPVEAGAEAPAEDEVVAPAEEDDEAPDANEEEDQVEDEEEEEEESSEESEEEAVGDDDEEDEEDAHVEDEEEEAPEEEGAALPFVNPDEIDWSTEPKNVTQGMMLYMLLLNKCRLTKEEIEKLPKDTKSVLSMAECIFDSVKLKHLPMMPKSAFCLASELIHLSKLQDKDIFVSEMVGKPRKKVSDEVLACLIFVLARVKRPDIDATHFEDAKKLLESMEAGSTPRRLMDIIIYKYSNLELYTVEDSKKPCFELSEEIFDYMFKDSEDDSFEMSCKYFLVFLHSTIEEGRLTL